MRDVLQKVVTNDDLSALTAEERAEHYRHVCESLGLNPATQPFQYLRLQGKLTLYARRDCTEQLRKKYDVSVQIMSRDRLDDAYIVTARATMPSGRMDESIGVVSLAGLKGQDLANALMRAETKAKRRVTLSIVGLGWLDESEIETVADAQRVAVDTATGEVLPSPTQTDTDGGNGRGNGSGNKPEAWQTANKQLHAKFTHEAIHDAAVAVCKVKSVSDCTEKQLKALEGYLLAQSKQNPDVLLKKEEVF